MEALDTTTIPDFCLAETLVLGCGNIFFGDDGFGCAVAEEMERREQPGSMCVLDAGTSVRKILFTLCLSPVRPRRVVIVDAIDAGRAPGEIFEIDPDDIPHVKLDDFSMHQLPTSNLLRELKQLCGVDVRILACQAAPLPETVAPGLSEPVRDAVGRAAAWLSNLVPPPAEVSHAE
jgi:coenzyme F420 hydrogenase subunit delta